MKKYYYICPRCGRRWRYFLPRREMKCPFCGQEWNTKKRPRGSSSRYSVTATLLWLFWILVVLAIVVKGLLVLGFNVPLPEPVLKVMGGVAVSKDRDADDNKFGERKRPRAAAKEETSEKTSAKPQDEQDAASEKTEDAAEEEDFDFDAVAPGDSANSGATSSDDDWEW